MNLNKTTRIVGKSWETRKAVCCKKKYDNSSHRTLSAGTYFSKRGFFYLLYSKIETIRNPVVNHKQSTFAVENGL